MPSVCWARNGHQHSKQQPPTFLLRCAANLLGDIPPDERLAARVGCGGMAANTRAAAAGVAAAVAEAEQEQRQQPGILGRYQASFVADARICLSVLLHVC
jgi:hypothetical protein